ncbi:hypothetical protein AB0L40_21735 [Patulibacter sp. NPDC049589]|uniref:hypothetical protein n=1 Tax=Patulibacter sp. NPDC049589 TaxID=3154731 RepID=UPI0034320F4A
MDTNTSDTRSRGLALLALAVVLVLVNGFVMPALGGTVAWIVVVASVAVLAAGAVWTRAGVDG